MQPQAMHPRSAKRTPAGTRLMLLLVWAASLCALALLLSVATGAERVPEGAGATVNADGRWVLYTSVDHVRAIAVEAVGSARYAWVATDGGAACWDLGSGRCFSYTVANGLLSNAVLCVQVDAQRRKWFGTATGVSVLAQGYATPFDASDDVWQHYGYAEGLVSERVQAIGFSRGAGGAELKWFGTNAGVTVLDDSVTGTLRTRNYGAWDGMTSGFVTSLDVDDAGNVWCGTDNGISVLSGPNPVISVTMSTYTTPTVALASNRINQVLCTQGQVWVATDGGLSQRSANGRWSSHAPSRENRLPSPEARSVAVDGAGNVWLVLGNGQATALQPQGEWPIYSTVDGLPGAATFVAYDGQERLLFGTNGGGIGALDTDKRDDAWTTYRSGTGPASNQVRSLAVANGTVLCGTWDRGISVMRGNAWHSYAFGSGLASDYAGGVAVDSRGLKWVATQRALRVGMSGGVSVLDDAALTPTWATYLYSEASPLAYSYAVAAGAENQMWVGTDEGAFLIDHRGAPLSPTLALTTAFTLSSPVSSPVIIVQAIAVAPGGREAWFGTTAGLIYLDRRGASPVSVAFVFTRTDVLTGSGVLTNGLASNGILDVALDSEGRVWAGTAGGLSVLDHRGTSANPADDRWRTFLYGVSVRGVARDRQGCWWLATPQGAYRLCDGDTPFAPEDDVWERYSSADGLAGDDVSAVRVDSSTGHVWFATDHGLSELMPAAPGQTPTPTSQIPGAPTTTPTCTPTVPASATPTATGGATASATPTSTDMVTVTETPTSTRTGSTTPTATHTPSPTSTRHVLYLPLVLNWARWGHVLYLPVVVR